MSKNNLVERPEGVVPRRLFHLLAGSTIPLLALALIRDSYSILLLVTGLLALASVVAEIARFVFPAFNQYLRATFGVFFKYRETSRVTGMTYMVLTYLLALLIFEKPIAILAMLFLSVGDPFSAVIGINFGRVRIFKKSLEGAAACFLASLLAGFLLMNASSLYDGFRGGVLVAGALAASVIELLPLPMDDNVSIPLGSGLVMAMAQGLSG